MTETKTDDVFGKALEDYFLGDKQVNIQVKSDIPGLHDIPVHYMFRGLNDMPKLELIALKECKGKVIDIGAGSGSHALELQELGHEVVALDNSPAAVKVMKKRGVQQAICSDYKDVIKQQSFDTYLMLMNGLGLVQTIIGLKEFIQEITPELEKGAQVIAESADLYSYLDPMNIQGKNSKERYYGEVCYDLEYKNLKNYGFKWLYIDFNTLFSISKELSIKLEVLFEGGLDNYLVRITK